MDFRDRSIVLTGASAGIGRALALALAREGARLTLAARDATALEALARECRDAGGEALAVPTDVGRREDCERLVAAAARHYGRIDVLVNNAGITMWARFDALGDLTVFEDLIRVNYLGAVWLTHAALPELRRHRGLVVAVASLAGLTGVPERTGYAASKHAMIGFFDSLRIELRGSGVDVCVVAPDFVVSEIHRRAIGADGKALGTSPMQEGRIMTAERCAELIVAAMRKRRRLVITSARGRLGRWLKLIAPTWIDAIAARAIHQKR